MTTTKTSPSAKQLAFLDRKFKPRLISEAATADFIKSHALTHGKYIHHGTPKGRVIVRYMTNPNDPMVPHLHYYTEHEQTVRRIQNELMSGAHKPWDRNNQRRRESTYSFGVEFPNSRGSEPVFMSNVITKLERWEGRPSKQTGPYWTRIPGQIDVTKDTEPQGQRVFVNGELVDPGKVPDVLIDSTTSDLLSYYEKQLATREVREWADKVRAGEATDSHAPETI